MTITIQQTNVTDTHSIYTVNFFNCPIITTVTNVGSVVDFWLSDIYRVHSRRLAHLIIGLDIEWRPVFQRNATSRVALLQLCVGRRCLIFQLIHADCIPQSLRNFLLDQNFRFVGVGIEEDVEKLLEDYELSVANPVDLRLMAAEKLDAIELRRAGLKNLASATLGLEVVKPKRVTMSRWDSSWLSFEQVQYACVDAHLSFEIGKYLILMN